jgi:hypothetical protein
MRLGFINSVELIKMNTGELLTQLTREGLANVLSFKVDKDLTEVKIREKQAGRRWVKPVNFDTAAPEPRSIGLRNSVNDYKPFKDADTYRFEAELRAYLLRRIENPPPIKQCPLLDSRTTEDKQTDAKSPLSEVSGATMADALSTTELIRALAKETNTSIENAQNIVNGMRVNAATMAEVGKKLTKPKRLSVKDLSSAELNDEQTIQKAIDLVNQYQHVPIATLDEETSYNLRRARMVEKQDRDRRQKGIPLTLT